MVVGNKEAIRALFTVKSNLDSGIPQAIQLAAVEALGDAVSSERHRLVGLAKDVAAGSVLIAAAGAIVVAALVFGPHILRLTGATR